MSMKTENWIQKRVESALQTTSVSEKIQQTVKSNLEGQMKEKALSPVELKEIAKTLLENLNPTLPEEVQSED